VLYYESNNSINGKVVQMKKRLIAKYTLFVEWGVGSGEWGIGENAKYWLFAGF